MDSGVARRLFERVTNGGFGAITMAKLDGYLDKTAVSYAIKRYKKMRGNDRYIDTKVRHMRPRTRTV